jgi:hypothetical protein
LWNILWKSEVYPLNWKRIFSPILVQTRQSVCILTNYRTLWGEMLVHEYLNKVMNSWPYKYSATQTLIKDIRRMGIWDTDTSEITSALSESFNTRLAFVSSSERCSV